MELEENNVEVKERYKELGNEYYKEPVNRTFDDVTASVLKELMSDKSVLESEFESEVEVASSAATEIALEAIEFKISSLLGDHKPNVSTMRGRTYLQLQSPLPHVFGPSPAHLPH